MKNWKYIEGAKTGNIAADITTDGNTWFVTTSDGKKKEFPSEREAESYVKKIKTGNEDKTGAEEFFKQLSDDVKEREKKDDADIEKVGNSLIGKTVWVKKSDGHQYKATVLREDGGRVYVNTGDGDQFWRLKHEVEVINKVGNFKTGKSALKPGDRVQSYGVQGTVRKVEGENSDNIYGEPIIEVEWDNGTVKKIGEHYLRKIGNKKLKFTDKKDGLKEFVYDEENDKGYIYYDGKLVDTIPHAGQGWLNLIKQKAFSSGVMNKVGNKVVWKEGPYRIEEVEKDGKFGFYNIPKGSFNAYRNSVLYGNFKTLDSAKAKMNEEIRLDKEYNRKYTTNSKTGNQSYKFYGEVIDIAKTDTNTLKEILEELRALHEQGDFQRAIMDELRKRKVGNARYTTREDVISHLDTDLYDICKKVPAGSPSFAYVSELQKKGWDISTISKYTKEIGKIIDQYKVGNASVGNAKDKNGKELRIGDIVLVWTSAGERAGKVKAISGDRITVAIRNEGDWSTPGKLADKVSNSKAKNEAPDDKFAYVMREFDEGKLKTPDGKVVTDPAQAKAIAYSESKKTENGLARARNAMNKRCGNSQVTLWKGSDSVLISEDGTVQYLESNSFETDRDKYGSMQEAIDDLTKKGYRKK